MINICTCGHIESSHKISQITICWDCVTEGITGSRWSKASHNFKRDNLRYLEKVILAKGR